ncbi:alpha/beta hydrolase [Nocardioides sp. NPDC006303]|uniref:alpha/beta fold hydrolase n=1 Tax=Nocardioides sp. NPDC006303 TaxID=3156747 RepID=UPI0033B0C33A
MTQELFPGTVAGTVKVGDAVVGYHDAGEQHDGRPVVLMVHGTGGSVEAHFFTLFPMLASRGRVIGIDLGDSGDGPLEVDDLVAQVAAVMDERCPDDAVTLVGYSMGSCVAAATAAAVPDRVDSLVLLNGWAQTDNAMRLRFDLWHRLYNERDLTSFREFMVMNIYGRAFLNAIPYIGPRPWSQVLQMCSDYVAGPSADRHMAMNSRMDIADRVVEISCRTLVIACRGDQLVPLEHSYELFGAIAESTLAEIPGGHASVAERPAHLFHLIDRFLREPEAFKSGSRIGDDVVLQLAALERKPA